MALTKQTIIDKVETVKMLDHFVLQVREAIKVFEDSNLVSQTFHRYVLQPNHDASTISDATVKAQFEAVMTDEIKANYQTFLASQKNPK